MADTNGDIMRDILGDDFDDQSASIAETLSSAKSPSAPATQSLRRVPRGQPLAHGNHDYLQSQDGNVHDQPTNNDCAAITSTQAEPGGLVAFRKAALAAICEPGPRKLGKRSRDDAQLDSSSAHDGHQRNHRDGRQQVDLRSPSAHSARDRASSPAWLHAYAFADRCKAAFPILEELKQQSDAAAEAMDDSEGSGDTGVWDRATEVLAGTLKEKNTTALWNTAVLLGLGPVIQLLKDTLQAEQSGGVPTADGARRRTTGGVFFYLLKNLADKDQYKVIFQEKIAAHQRRVRARRRVAGEGAGGQDKGDKMFVDRPEAGSSSASAGPSAAPADAASSAVPIAMLTPPFVAPPAAVGTSHGAATPFWPGPLPTFSMGRK